LSIFIALVQQKQYPRCPIVSAALPAPVVCESDPGCVVWINAGRSQVPETVIIPDFPEAVCYLLRVHSPTPESIEILRIQQYPDNWFAVSGSTDRTLEVWDLKTGEEVVSFIGEGPLLICAIAPDGVDIVSYLNSLSLYIIIVVVL